jgi:poly-gamma-glutamate capsule biosynthesis protein CapA/YwtB (metallophosphatase superfamily)
MLVFLCSGVPNQRPILRLSVVLMLPLHFVIWKPAHLLYNSAMLKNITIGFVPSCLLVSLLLWSGCASVTPLATTVEQVQPTVVPTPSPTPAPLLLVTGGDVLPACFLDPYLKQKGHAYPYQKIAPYFQDADIGLVNLECPLSLRGQRYRKKKFTFRAHPDAVQGLKQAGITAVSLGNNHIMDYGADALYDTLETLEQAEIAFAGGGKNLTAARAPARLSFSNNRTVALLSYTMTYPAAFWAGRKKPGTAFARLPMLEADITSATAWANWVIVSFHWGGELKHYPKSYQKQFGRAAIDYGADVVVGTHPHVLQGFEWYKKRLILYSLGNLAFGGGRSRRATESALVKIYFHDHNKSLTAYTLPLNVNNTATHFIPTPLPGEKGKEIFQALETYSRAWGTRIQVNDSGWGQLLAPETVFPQTQTNTPTASGMEFKGEKEY